MMSNYDILKEYEAHQTPVPSYEEWKALNGNMDSVIQTNQALCKKLLKFKEQINKCCLDAINRGTANTVKAVKEFGMPERIEELVKQNAQLKERVSKLEKMQYSYTPEEWNTMLRTVNRTKELLKEVKDYLPEFETPMDILAKIDEVLK